MYTTLATLKAVSACKDGFTTQLAFWGISKEVKDQRIPLHAIALISNVSDMQWILSRGVTIIPSEYDELLKRHTLDVWRTLLRDQGVYRDLQKMQKVAPEKGSYIAGRIPASRRSHGDEEDVEDASSFKNPGFAFYRRAVDCTTSAEVDRFRAEARLTTSELGLWNVVNHQVWISPTAMINFIIDVVCQDDEDTIIKYKDNGKVVTLSLFDGLCNSKLDEAERVATALKTVGTYDFLYELQLDSKRSGVKVERDVTTHSFVVRVDDTRIALRVVKAALQRSEKKALVQTETIREADAEWGTASIAASEEVNVSSAWPGGIIPPTRNRATSGTAASRATRSAAARARITHSARENSANSDDSDNDE